MDRIALLIIDVQYDFLPPSGSLAAEHGEEILPIIEDLLDETKWDWPVIVASQDYHPRDHISFATTHPPHKPFEPLLLKDARGTNYEQTLWPEHCIQGTKGSEIEESVKEKLDKWSDKVKLSRKGTHIGLEAYSAFEGYITEFSNPSEPTLEWSSGKPPESTLPEQSPLSLYLRQKGIEKVVIVGLATDFCVFQTALSSISASFDTLLLGPAMRGISKEGTEKAFERLRSMGGTVIDQGDTNWNTKIRDWAK
ncbi:uncharacterized protein L201_007106 [Kwoniella dendrophila CBS 6074]|uniref:nicotinamidase n=1 Tax=Kwoniella dendrophila CBS 6074 TaxID=1295534 RepID=A0AAX4K3L8_9TREE